MIAPEPHTAMQMLASTRAARRAGLCLPLLVALACSRADEPAAPDVAPGAARPTPADSPARPSDGRYQPARSAPDPGALTPEQRLRIEQLNAIGYVDGSLAPQGSGVSRHEPGRAQTGLNFYSSGHGPEALLIDMEGRELHRWRMPFAEAFPGRPEHDQTSATFWRRAFLLEDGSVLAIFEGLGLVKVDRDSKLEWASPVRAHHDLHVMPDGEIYVLTREAHLLPRIHPEEPVVEDFVSILDARGREQARISLLEAFERSRLAGMWRAAGIRDGYLFHTNSIEVLDGSLADRLPAFAAGNVLVSMRRFSTIAVVDLGPPAVVWARKGGFRAQHDPKVLANGNLLLFDNQGRGAASAALELDPATPQPVWSYRGSREAPFFSATCGTAERLANGNTLLTESDNGRAFEVTPEGEIVWEFYNPHRAGPRGEFIATLFELVRLPAEFPLGWLGEDGGPGVSERR